MAKLDQEARDDLGERQFAFPKEGKEPLEDATHVRNAVARFDQVKGVSDAERDEAWMRIEAAAKKFKVELKEKSWRELGKPSSGCDQTAARLARRRALSDRPPDRHSLTN